MRVLVAVLLAGCVLSASAKQGSFVDYLSTKKSAGAKTSGAKPSSYDYAPAELLESCLKPIAVETCHGYNPTGGTSFPYLVNYEMGCCHAKKSYSKELNTYLAKPTPVGNCKITYLPYLDTPAGPLKKRNDQATHDWVAENVEEIGRFEMQCSLNDESGECGHPFCEKMVLSASGDLYAVSNAIVSSTPPLLTDTNDQCLIGDDITRLPSLRKSKSTKARKADYYQESEHYYEEEGYSYSYLKKVDYAFVISGPVTVNSRLHGLKEIEDAWLEAVVDYGMLTEKEPENATEEEAHKAYVLDPYTYKFSFIKSKEY